MPYSKEVNDRFYNVLNNPKKFSVGRFDPKDPDVATGMTGAPACGDVMKLQLKLDINERIIDSKDVARNHALLDLSSSIATSILSDMDLAMKEQTVVTVGENGEQNEEYQLEDFFAYNLQTTSEAYIQNATYRSFKIEDENYFYAFKNKKEFLKETNEVNEFILREAGQSFEKWQISTILIKFLI